MIRFGMKAVLLLIFSAAVLASPGEVGIDRPYNDLPGMPVKSNSATDCSNLCDQNQACVTWSFNTPQAGCGDQSLCWLKSVAGPVVWNKCMTSSVKGRKLTPLKYMFLPANAIKPTGWLLQQLQAQATGLAGHLAEFWPNIQNSVWIGGDSVDPGGLGERVPYWLNGLVPTAYQTGDQATISQVQKYLNYIMDHQKADGSLGQSDDPWPTMPLLLALIQYAELEPSARDRVVGVIWKFFQWQRHQLLTVKSLDSWAWARYQDLLISIFWMLDNHPNGQEDFLYTFAETVHGQGIDWLNFFKGDGAKHGTQDFPTGPCYNGCPQLATHGVNIGQGLKSSAVWYRYSRSDDDMQSSTQRVQMLDKYHGMASGIFSCSEHLGGLDASQGSETCTVVEALYSYQWLFAHTGSVDFGDRIELLAYNALPGSMTSDTWAHVYLQQPNMISSQHADPSVYVSDGPDSNIYGLEPNFGCCTANFVQGWPKFVSSMFMSTSDGGLIAVSYGPASVETTVGGGNVKINANTAYPFNETIIFSITSGKGFPLHLRIPTWTTGATIRIGKKIVKAKAGSVAKVTVPAGTTNAVIKFPMKFRAEARPGNAVAIHRGPILYSVDIGANQQQTKNYYMGSSDFTVTATKPWNWAIQLGQNLETSLHFSSKKSVGSAPFSETGSPVSVTARAKQVDWGIDRNAAAVPPNSPVNSNNPLVNVTLLPFGSLLLRMTELPTFGN